MIPLAAPAPILCTIHAVQPISGGTVWSAAGGTGRESAYGRPTTASLRETVSHVADLHVFQESPRASCCLPMPPAEIRLMGARPGPRFLPHVEVFCLSVVDYDGRCGLFRFELEFLAQRHADALGFKKRPELSLILESRTGWIAEAIP